VLEVRHGAEEVERAPGRAGVADTGGDLVKQVGDLLRDLEVFRMVERADSTA